MSIIKKITILLGIFFISGVAQVSAQEIKKIGKYKDWEAMVVMDADGKVCFAQSLPIFLISWAESWVIPLIKNIPKNIVIFLIMDMDLDKLFVLG